MKTTQSYVISMLFALTSAELSEPATSDLSYDPSLSSCLDFASRFDNTCSSTSTAGEFSSIGTATQTCAKRSLGSDLTTEVSGCPTTSTTTSDTDCTYERKLCITCREDSSNVVYVRA